MIANRKVPKAKLVVCEYQIRNNYDTYYAPVTSIVSVGTLLCVANNFNY